MFNFNKDSGIFSFFTFSLHFRFHFLIIFELLVTIYMYSPQSYLRFQPVMCIFSVVVYFLLTLFQGQKGTSGNGKENLEDSLPRGARSGQPWKGVYVCLPWPRVQREKGKKTGGMGGREAGRDREGGKARQ